MRVAIIGMGSMGSWLAGLLVREHELAVFDTDRDKVPLRSGVRVLERLEELAEFGPDMLINAVSLESTVVAFEAALPQLPGNCLLVDLASVKGGLPEFYGRSGYRFVSVHPMFGPTFSDMVSLENENAVIIEEGDRDGAAFFDRLFRRLGIRVFRYHFQEHDEMMAYSLTTPFVSSLVFAACLTDTAVPGTTFSRHLRIARGLLSENDHLLAEVLFNPRSVTQLDRINSRLTFLKHIIEARDYEEAGRFFQRLRDNLAGPAKRPAEAGRGLPASASGVAPE